MTKADIHVAEIVDNRLIAANEGLLNKREVVTEGTL